MAPAADKLPELETKQSARTKMQNSRDFLGVEICLFRSLFGGDDSKLTLAGMFMGKFIATFTTPNWWFFVKGIPSKMPQKIQV